MKVNRDPFIKKIELIIYPLWTAGFFVDEKCFRSAIHVLFQPFLPLTIMEVANGSLQGGSASAGVIRDGSVMSLLLYKPSTAKKREQSKTSLVYHNMVSLKRNRLVPKIWWFQINTIPSFLRGIFFRWGAGAITLVSGNHRAWTTYQLL